MLLTLVIVGNSINYIKMTGTIREQVLETSANEVKSIQISMETVISVINNSLMQTALDSELKHFSNRYELLDIFDRQQIYKRLNQLRATNKYFDKLYVYYFDDGKVVDLNGTNATYVDLDQMKNKDMLINAKLLFNQGGYFKSLFVYNLEFDESEKETVMIMPVNPIDYHPQALIIMTLNKTFFQGLLMQSNIADKANIYILDKEGQLLFGRNPNAVTVNEPGMKDKEEGYLEIDVNGTEYFTTFITSQETGWKFVYEVPAKHVFSKLRSTKLFLSSLALMSIVYVVVITVLVANELHRPVKKVIATLLGENKNETETIRDEMGFINQNIVHLISEKKSIEQLLAENQPFLKNAALEKLITDTSLDSNDMFSRLRYYGTPIVEDRFYGVCILDMDQFDSATKKFSNKQMDERLICLREIIESYIENWPHLFVEIVHSRRNELILLLCMDTAIRSSAENSLQAVSMGIFEQITKAMDISFVIGVSDICDDLSRINSCYEQAGKACNYKIIAGNNKVIYFSNVPALNKKQYKYPFNLEEGIFNCLKQPDRDEIKAAIERYFTYAKENMQSYDQIKYTFIQLLNDTMKVLMELSINSDLLFPETNTMYEQVLSLGTIDEVQSFFNEIFGEIHEYICDKKANSQKDVPQKIMDYINCYYAKEDISLDLLATEMHYSVSYLVKVFKYATGKSIKECITEKRIEKAKEYLATKDMKILDIASKVGYSDTRSFINNFKKSVGVTPNLYKTKLIQEEAEKRTP